jgi:DNA-binding response OmpR family regulator
MGIYSRALHDQSAQSILVVDDARATQRRIALQLQRAGFTVVTADSGPRALEWVRRSGLPRLVLLDVGMAGMNGFAVADALRAMGDVPIIFLSPLADAAALGEDAARYAGDYLLKPFADGELLDSIQRALTRSELPPMADLEAVVDAGLRINFAQQYIVTGGERVALTPTETRLLHLLYCHRGRVVSPGYLMSKAWDARQKGTLGSLWVHIRRLRNKLEAVPDFPRYLLTVRGQGYMLRAETGRASLN